MTPAALYHPNTSPPLHNHPRSNFRVRAKEPTCPNEKALDEERRPFSRKAELTVANKRHDRDEIGSPESDPGRDGGTEGEKRDRHRERERDAHEDK